MTKSTKFFATAGIVGALGVVCALPSAIHAADPTTATAETSITANIGESASIDIDVPAVSGDLTTGAEPQPIGDPGHITVATNAPKGYTLTVKSYGEDTALHSQTTASTDKIPYGAPEQNKSAWGLYIGGKLISSLSATAGTEIDKTDVPTTGSGKIYDVLYKASAGLDQAQGTYKGSVIFTVSTNA